MNKKILQLAIPSIISNITVPFIGLIDVAIVGHLGSASYIGAIAVGGMLFNITTDIRVSPYGDKRYDFPSVRETGFDGSYPDLIPSVGVGFLISLGLLILQYLS